MGERVSVPGGYLVVVVGVEVVGALVEVTLCMGEQGPSLNAKSSTAISPV